MVPLPLLLPEISVKIKGEIDSLVSIVVQGKPWRYVYATR